MEMSPQAPEFIALGYCSNDHLCRVPSIPIDHKVEIIEHQIQGGGPAADAAVAAARLGLRTMFLTSVGATPKGSGFSPTWRRRESTSPAFRCVPTAAPPSPTAGWTPKENAASPGPTTACGS